MSSTQNGIRKSMDNIRATEEMKQNTLRYLEMQRTRQKHSIFRRKPYTTLRYAVAVVFVFFWLGQADMPCIADLCHTLALM